jgi:hypothetical protein
MSDGIQFGVQGLGVIGAYRVWRARREATLMHHWCVAFRYGRSCEATQDVIRGHRHYGDPIMRRTRTNRRRHWGRRAGGGQ